MENKIIFLLVVIILLYLMFTKKGIEGLKSIINILTGTKNVNDVSASLDKAMGINQPEVERDTSQDHSGGFDIPTIRS